MVVHNRYPKHFLLIQLFWNFNMLFYEIKSFQYENLKEIDNQIIPHIASNLPFETSSRWVWIETVIKNFNVSPGIITHLFAVIHIKKIYPLLKNIEINFNKWSIINCDLVEYKKIAYGWQISAEICDTKKASTKI